MSVGICLVGLQFCFSPPSWNSVVARGPGPGARGPGPRGAAPAPGRGARGRLGPSGGREMPFSVGVTGAIRFHSESLLDQLGVSIGAALDSDEPRIHNARFHILCTSTDGRGHFLQHTPLSYCRLCFHESYFTLFRFSCVISARCVTRSWVFC